MEIQVEVRDGGVLAALGEMARRGQQPRRVFEAIGQDWVRSVVKNFEAGGRPDRWPAQRGGKAAHLQDTGRLKRAIHARVLSDGVAVGTNTRYARLHQLGGWVKPKKARGWLAIPAEKSAATRAGAAAFMRRHLGRAFAVYNEGKKGTIFLADGRGGAKPMFWLRRKVKVPARPFLLAQSSDVTRWANLLAQHVAEPLT